MVKEQLDKRLIARYLGVNQNHIEFIDEEYFSNYIKVYTDTPSNMARGQMIAEFKVKLKDKTLRQRYKGFSRAHNFKTESSIDIGIEECKKSAKSFVMNEYPNQYDMHLYPIKITFLYIIHRESVIE